MYIIVYRRRRSQKSEMLRSCDEDSGRSSCSAASVGLSPIIDCREKSSTDVKTRYARTQEASTNTDLKVSRRPRSYVDLMKSPDEKDPFPSCRASKHPRNSIFHLFDNVRMGGLSNAHSTLEIGRNPLEQPAISNNVISLSTAAIDKNIRKPLTNFRRGKPVQRAASRLYKAEGVSKGKDCCVGPEFIVRASQPVKHMDLTIPAILEKRVITVVLLNGQRVEILCDPNVVTAGHLFEALVHSEKYEHNFMLGIAVLIGGDFVFIPDDYKIKKLAPEGWNKVGNKKKFVDEEIALTVFLRIKFFLPTNIAKNIQGGEWRHRVYLQLRRATVEGQLTSVIQNLIMLAGYALHIEFGEFSYREHGSADYFLLEHYLPETAITNDMSDIKLKMKRAHESRCGLDRNKAIINFITLAQTFRDYGAHFYSAVWATRDGFCRDVWLSVGPRGVTLYSRSNHASEESGTNRIVLQSLPWHHIHTFYYNKKSLYIMPNSHSGLSKIGVKYKLKMSDNKSYFTFWLASLHHRLYLKLYAKEDFINYLSDELSCPLNKDGSLRKAECSNYEDSYNLAVRNQLRTRRPVKRRFRVDIFGDKKTQDKENTKPNTEELLRRILSPQPSEESLLQCGNNLGNASNDGFSSSESCSLPRRRGVKMGTRVFNGMKSVLDQPRQRPESFVKTDCDPTTTQSDSDDLEVRQHCSVDRMELLPARQYHQQLTHAATAYVLESPKVYPEAFSYNPVGNDSCINTSLFDKLDNMECVQGERIFVTSLLERDKTNALGLQVAEGSDGNVYIKSITSGGPADVSRKLLPGDQIISVNGQTLLNVKYDKALGMLQSAPHFVELIVLQNAKKNSTTEYSYDISGKSESKLTVPIKSDVYNGVGSALDGEITDDELLNEEALKTIYALIKLTKEKVISRMKDKASRQNTPVKSNMQKCFSEMKLYEESDVENYSSQESTPQKKGIKFNTWRGQLPAARSKRRPLSVSIPPGVDLADDCLDSAGVLKNSLPSGQSSLNSLDKSLKSCSSKSVALPRNYGLGRRWVGPVRYPVTPCKDTAGASAMVDDSVTRRHFVYGAENSDEDQIFL